MNYYKLLAGLALLCLSVNVKALSDTLQINTSGITLTAIVQEATGTNANGQIHLFISGSASPFTCLWDNGYTSENRSGLAPGNYSVTINGTNNQQLTQHFSVGTAILWDTQSGCCWSATGNAYHKTSSDNSWNYGVMRGQNRFSYNDTLKVNWISWQVADTTSRCFAGCTTDTSITHLYTSAFRIVQEGRSLYVEEINIDGFHRKQLVAANLQPGDQLRMEFLGGFRFYRNNVLLAEKRIYEAADYYLESGGYNPGAALKKLQTNLTY